MANKTVTVKTSGGDYTTLNAALAGEAANLVTGTCILTIECYSMTDTTTVEISGYTTNESYYIKITSPDGQAYVLSVTNVTCIANYEDFVRIEKITIATVSPSANGKDCFHVGDVGLGASNDIRISRCTFKGHNHATRTQSYISCDDSNAILKFYNNIFWNIKKLTDNYGIYLNACASTLIYNNTISGAESCVVFFEGNVTLKNNIFSGSTYAVYDIGTLNAASDYNVANTDDTGRMYVVEGGTHTHDHTEHTFTFVSASDFHLQSTDAGAIGYGVVDPGAGLFSDDIDGVVRRVSGTWDCGADEYAGADSMSYFSDSTVADGTNVVSYINKTILVNAIQSDSSDNYFDSTDKLNKVYVYYTDPGNRELKSIRHEIDGTNLKGYVSWSSFAGDGTWQKIKVKAYDLENALHVLNRAAIGSGEDITHSSGIMHLNRI